MFTALHLLPFACPAEEAVVDLPATTDYVPAEDRVAHAQEDLIHAKRVIFSQFLCSIKVHARERLHDITLQ